MICENRTVTPSLPFQSGDSPPHTQCGNLGTASAGNVLALVYLSVLGISVFPDFSRARALVCVCVLVNLVLITGKYLASNCV